MSEKSKVEVVPHEETEVVRKPVKKHSRRAALKFLAKVGLGAALWGTGGYFAGKIFGSTVKPVVDSVLGTSERISSAYEGLKRLNPFYKAPIVPSPSTTRRGSLSSLVRSAYQHPIAAGTIAGTTYGVGKYALSGASKYLTDRQIGILKDENADYKERLVVLEDYRSGVQKDLKRKDGRIEDLEKNLAIVNKAIRDLQAKPGKLEEAASEGDVPDEVKEMLLSFGVVGMLITLTFFSTNPTGYAVFNSEITKTSSAIIAIFIVSLGLVLLGAGKRKTKVKKKKKKR